MNEKGRTRGEKKSWGIHQETVHLEPSSWVKGRKRGEKADETIPMASDKDGTGVMRR